ncbi:MAG TPA: hypothetical protein PKC98_04730 [Candidatus Melainabacteria bacterium]|nr:hypothetical protein [Candidatus Melainabacteria bacterium]
MKFLLSSLVTLVLVGLFNFAPLHAQESKPADKPAAEEQKTDTAKTEKADEPAVEPEKAVDAEKDKDKTVEPAVCPPQPGNEPVPKKIDIGGENPFNSDKYKTIDVDLEYKANPAADSIFIFFNYLTMAAMVVMVVSVAIWVFKNRDKLADSGTSSSVSPKAASNKEDEAEEKSEDKAEEKPEDKAEEKSEDKAEEKSEEKAEENSEEKAEEKSEEKAEEKPTRKKSSKGRGKSGKSKKSDV